MAFGAGRGPKEKCRATSKRCECGWLGLPHYRVRGETKREDAQVDRCITYDQLRKYTEIAIR
jgi:hypothetical protein